ncbi:histidine kinase [Leifsonia sp. F6_8S_P_1B]|uniref:histidine kinase n=1 Tax=Leifsonia williamsii TaxID=3035919 RepID=A0ABT8KCD5_9MICO|nr:histidine kinase [Leifsonia williamsii]MDN4615111.1 histidine kinase [Leifsonia williamsii]
MTSASTPSAAAAAPGALELPRPPGAVRRFLAAHPLLVDAAVALVYLIPSVAVGIATVLPHPTPQTITTTILAAVAGVALFARRHHPAVVFGVTIGTLAATIVFAESADILPAMLALYALAAYRSARAAWIAFGVLAVVSGAAILTARLLQPTGFLSQRPGDPIIVALGVLVLSAFAVLIGSSVGSRRRYLAALIDLARQLARERDQQAEIATAAERSRIAREMHDIVSHSLTVMITLADGSARLAQTAPERSAETMRLVAETGRGALGDMRRLLGVLRAAEDGTAVEHEPQPGIAELGVLIERFRAAGLPVRITVTGTPPDDVGRQLTVFRVVQEALTNALRYAPLADTVEATLRFDRDTIVITVEDDAAMHGPVAPGSGRGLIGLRERVALYGGRIETGPRPGGGWRVHAELPAAEGQAVPAAQTPGTAPTEPTAPTASPTTEDS